VAFAKRRARWRASRSRCVAGDYDRRSRSARSADWLADRTRRRTACLVANDIMALGVLDALHAAGQRSAVVGVNAIPEAIAAIRDGRMLATADFNAMQMAALATEVRGPPPARPARCPSASSCRCASSTGRTGGPGTCPYAERPLLTLEQLESRG
jgi:ribose transport system substrate-binding protein